MSRTLVRWLGCLVVMLLLGSEALAQEDLFYRFRNGSAWGMPQTGLVCLGTKDVSTRQGSLRKQLNPTEVLAVMAPRGSQVRLVRVNPRSRFVFWPDQLTAEKLAVVPEAGFVQFAFTDSKMNNPRTEPWDEGSSFEIRVRFPDGRTVPPVRIARACGFHVEHAASSLSMRALGVAASAAQGGTRTPADVEASTRVRFRLDTTPNLGGQNVAARMWIAEDVVFSARARWSVADNIVVGARGVVMSDIPLASTGVVYGARGTGFLLRTLALLNSPGGITREFALPPTWRIREGGNRTFRTNRPGGYGYLATAAVRAQIVSNSPLGDVLVSTAGKASGLWVGFVPTVPF